MIPVSPFSERLQTVFSPTERGVIGLVDDLMGLSREHGLRLEFQDNCCTARPLESDTREVIDVPLPKSVFRAVVARVAALCNECAPDSVTPYSGDAKLTVGTNPPSTFQVSFMNTPAEQRLEVQYLGEDWQ